MTTLTIHAKGDVSNAKAAIKELQATEAQRVAAEKQGNAESVRSAAETAKAKAQTHRDTLSQHQASLKAAKDAESAAARAFRSAKTDEARTLAALDREAAADKIARLRQVVAAQKAATAEAIAAEKAASAAAKLAAAESAAAKKTAAQATKSERDNLERAADAGLQDLLAKTRDRKRQDDKLRPAQGDAQGGFAFERNMLGDRFSKFAGPAALISVLTTLTMVLKDFAEDRRQAKKEITDQAVDAGTAQNRLAGKMAKAGIGDGEIARVLGATEGMRGTASTAELAAAAEAALDDGTTDPTGLMRAMSDRAAGPRAMTASQRLAQLRWQLARENEIRTQAIQIQAGLETLGDESARAARMAMYAEGGGTLGVWIAGEVYRGLGGGEQSAAFWESAVNAGVLLPGPGSESNRAVLQRNIIRVELPPEQVQPRRLGGG